MFVFAANAQYAPSHAVGRGTSAPTPRQVSGCGFRTSCLLRSTAVAHSPCAHRPLENRPTAHGPRARWRTQHFAFAANAQCAPSHAVDRGSSAPTQRQVGGCDFRMSRSLRSTPMAHSPRSLRRWRTGRRPTEHARAGGLGVVVFSANARRAPSHAVGRGSSAPTPRQDGSCGFETSWQSCSISVPRGPSALRPVEN